jgi:hypothetical protein
MMAFALLNHLPWIMTVEYALAKVAPAYQNVFIHQSLIAVSGSPGSVTTSDVNARFPFREDGCALGPTIAVTQRRLLAVHIVSRSHFEQSGMIYGEKSRPWI